MVVETAAVRACKYMKGQHNLLFKLAALVNKYRQNRIVEENLIIADCSVIHRVYQAVLRADFAFKNLLF